MDIKGQMTAIGILGMIFGLGYLVVPTALLGFFGIEVGPGSAIAARFFGGSIFAWGVLGLTARGVPGRAGLGAIAGAFFVAFLLGTILAVWGSLAGALNAFGWVAAAFFAIVAAAMGIYRFTGRGS